MEPLESGDRRTHQGDGDGVPPGRALSSRVEQLDDVAGDRDVDKVVHGEGGARRDVPAQNQSSGGGDADSADI